MPKIKVKAMCVFLHDEKILVKEISRENGTVFRPLGGHVEFGEHSTETLAREMKEEIGADITMPEYLGILENIWEDARGKHHQVSFVYDAKFIDPKFYSMEEVPVNENGGICKAVWRPLTFFIAKEAPLYPEGLLELLMR